MAGCSSTVLPALLCASVSPQHTEGCWGVGGARLPVQHHLGGRNGQQTLTPLSPCGFSRRAAPSTEGVKAPSTPPSPSPLLPRALPRVFPLPHLLCTPGSARPPPAAPAALCGDGEGVGRKRRRGADPKSAPPPKPHFLQDPQQPGQGGLPWMGQKGSPGWGARGARRHPLTPPPNPAPSLAPPTPLPSPLPPGTHLSDRVPPSSCAPPTCAAPPCSILALTCPHDSPSPGCYVPTVFQPYASPPHNTAPLPHPVPAAPHSPIGFHHHPASPHLSIPAVPVPVAALSP